MGRRSQSQCHRAPSPGSSALPVAARGSCPALTHTPGHRDPSGPAPSGEREEIPSCSTLGTPCWRWGLRKGHISSSLNGNCSHALGNRMGRSGVCQALGTAVPGRGQGCAQCPCSTRSAPHGLWVCTAAGGEVPSPLALPCGVWNCPAGPGIALRGLALPSRVPSPLALPTHPAGGSGQWLPGTVGAFGPLGTAAFWKR